MQVREPLLGTRGEVAVFASEPSTAEAAEATALAEAERLEAIFTIFDPASALHALRSTGTSEVPELNEVHRLAIDWAGRTSGAFHPGIEPVVELWANAQETQTLPSNDAIAEALSRVAQMSTKHLNLNGIAKGWIADQALSAALTAAGAAATEAWLSLGGDLVHSGEGSLRVGIEDPHRPYDNVAPLVTVEISNEALATSGSARRYWTIDGEHFSRVIDPRTGRPTSAVSSATVIANTAATADVLATAAMVLHPTDTVALIDELEAECFLVLDDKSIVETSTRFRRA